MIASENASDFVVTAVPGESSDTDHPLVRLEIAQLPGEKPDFLWIGAEIPELLSEVPVDPLHLDDVRLQTCFILEEQTVLLQASVSHEEDEEKADEKANVRGEKDSNQPHLYQSTAHRGFSLNAVPVASAHRRTAGFLSVDKAETEVVNLSIKNKMLSASTDNMDNALFS